MPAGNPSIPLTALGVRLRDLRIRAGLTQCEMAGAMNTGANRISDWETGRYEPTLPVLKRYAEVYGMTVSGILQRIM
jgi:transcriptional regulator with XRE-family HTH domain